MSLKKRAARHVPSLFIHRGLPVRNVLLLLAGLLVIPQMHAASAPAATSTSLTVSAPQVQPGTVVTLTASVAAGGPLTVGQVNFCDAAATYCTDVHLLGSAQLTSAGTATLSFVPGIGSHSYKAIFPGTGSAMMSVSETATVVVAGTNATTTSIASSGTQGNYTVTATVSGAAAEFPSGMMSFVDTNAGNETLATANLVAGTTSINMTNSARSNGDDAYSVVAGDFNGDGHLDLAVTNIHQSSVSVLLGNGDGTFKAAPTASSGGYPSNLAVGDFNGDGKTDLAVASVNDNTVTILLGNGDGTFTTGPVLATGSEPQVISVGDLNGDGKADFVVSNYGGETVTVWLGNGDGTFTAAPTLQNPGGPDGIMLADLNGDGKLDMAVTNWDSGTVTVWLGNGDGTFTQLNTFPAGGTNPGSVVAADFNGDGKADLAVANDGSNTVIVLLGKGDGTFTPQPDPEPESGPYWLAVGDFNGDGKADVAVLDQGNSTIGLLLGNGDGTFTATTGTSNGGYPQQVIAGDFNGDGLTDVVAANDANDANGESAVFLTHVTATATATATGVSPDGTGTHLVQASYPGDSMYAASVSGTTGLMAEATTPTVTLSVPPSAAYGNAVQVVASVTDAATSQTVNSGSVAFSDQHGGFGSQAVVNGSANISYLPSSTGTFALTGSFNPANASMNPASGQGTIEITAAPLTVTAASATRAYGASNPQFTGGVAGAVNGDSFTESFTTPATTASGVGTYPITPSAVGANVANYTQNVTPGTLTVTAAGLTVTANNATRLYGAVNPTFTGSETGALPQDGITVTASSTATTSSPVGNYAIVPVAIGAAVADYTSTVTDGTLTVQPAPLTAVAGSATRMYGAANPVFTGSLTGVVNGDQFQASYVTVATGTSAPGSYAVLAQVTGPAMGNYTLSATPGTLTVTQASTVITLTQAAAQASGPLQLQAQVASSTTGTPTGTVQFMSGGTVLAEGTLQNGSAAVSISQPAPGSTESVVAVYGGDANFQTGTSSAVALTENSQDFWVSANAAVLTQGVQAGGKAVFPLQVGPANGVAYPGVVSFSVTGLPEGATASFSPTTLAANSGAQTVTMTVQMPAERASGNGHWAAGAGGAALALLLLPFSRGRRMRSAARPWMLLAVLLLGGVAGGSLITGCGVNGVDGGWGAGGSYPLTVIMTSGGMRHTVTTTLVVQPVAQPAGQQ